ncbi:hypothetical protein [Planobispora longispora]|uniref:hypothetical protein n=1 Tax=Planobispora longispora TaxID=28887 RepID=UPI0035A22407
MPPPAELAGDGAIELEIGACLGAGDAGGWPYASSPDGRVPGADVRLRLVPYHRWGNRGPATMRVWMPV